MKNVTEQIGQLGQIALSYRNINVRSKPILQQPHNRAVNKSKRTLSIDKRALLIVLFTNTIQRYHKTNLTLLSVG